MKAYFSFTIIDEHDAPVMTFFDESSAKMAKGAKDRIENSVVLLEVPKPAVSVIASKFPASASTEKNDRFIAAFKKPPSLKRRKGWD